VSEFAAPDMTGIRSDYVTEVPPDDQARLAAAFPKIRLLWNAKLRVYQLAYREEGWREGFYGSAGDGWLDGWALIPPDYPPPLDIARVISELKVREVLQQENAARNEKLVSDAVDKWWDREEAKRKQAEADRTNDKYDYEWKRLFAPKVWSNAPVLGPGKKELARREKRQQDSVLREGSLIQSGGSGLV